MSSVLANIVSLNAGSVFDRAGATLPGQRDQVIAASTSDEIDDVECMHRIGRGDNGAYRRMVERYLPGVTRFAARLLGNPSEGEDVAQETFLRLWTEAARWTPRAQPKTWLYRVARNLCIDRLRKRRDAADVEQLSAAERPSGLLMRKQTSLEVERALESLPERQRAAITLVHYEGMDSAEACEVLEVGVEALESLLARGRRSLREQLRGLAERAGGERP